MLRRAAEPRPGAPYRLEVGGVGLAANGERARNGALGLVEAPARGRRPGYAVVAGRDSTRGGEVVVERGLARAWGLVVGQDLDVGRLGPLRVAGIAVSPDNVAYPLAAVPHVYVSKPWVEGLAGQRFAVNQALVWARDPADVDVLLQQARATSFGLADVRFVTKAGVRVLLDQAAGVVIALLVGFSLVALGAAAVMLGASARADVQRRLTVIGVQRALGVGRGSVAAEHGLTAAAVGLVAGTVGVAAGALLAAGPSDGLLVALNEQPPGAALVAPLAATALLVAALVGAATAWPAWQAAGRPPVALLRGGELAGTGAGRSRRPGRARAGGVGAGPGREVGRAGRAGPLTLGARLVAARRARTLASVAVLAVSGAVILLMLGLAPLVAALRDDPGSVGKRYALTARLPADRVAAVRALPGVAAASPRWVARGADSFSLGEPVKLVAFPGDHTEFEDPPLADGRHVGADDEAEVGVGLAQALGVRLGSTLAVQLPGGEARFRVVGTVRALDDDGRIAYVRPRRLLAADPSLAGEVVVRLRGAGDEARVRRGLTDLGADADGGGRRDDPRRRLPGHAGDAPARGRRRRRARVPLRPGPGARAHRPRAAEDALGPAGPRGRTEDRRCGPRRRGAGRRGPGRGRGGGPRAARARAARRPPGRELRRPGAVAPAGRGRARGLRPARARPRGGRVGRPHRPARGARRRAAGRVTVPRRIVLLLAVVAAAAAATGLVAACGAGGPGSAGRASAGPADGSTLRSAWVDPDGDGTPQRGPGEPLRDRTDLAPAARAGAVLGTLGILTDPHVRDEESPARAPCSTAWASRSPRPSARRTRCRCRSSSPASGRWTPLGPTPRSSWATSSTARSATSWDRAGTAFAAASCGPTAAPRATRASRRRATPTRPTTAPTSTRRGARGCSRRPSGPSAPPG